MTMDGIEPTVPDPSIVAGRDDDDDGNDDDEGEQIRVSFVLDPGAAAAAASSDYGGGSLDVPSDPIAVPSSVRRRGLSAVINHLLDRRVVGEEEGGDGESDDDDSDNDKDRLPAVPFDFLVNGRLLRTGVEVAARREGLSLERAVEVRYFPAARAPVGSGESEVLPDWITAVSYSSCATAASGAAGVGGRGGTLCTGCADGSIQAFGTNAAAANSSSTGKKEQEEGSASTFREIDSIAAHTGPVKCVSSLSASGASGGGGGGCLIASGSIDQTLLTHVLPPQAEKLALHAVYSGGHTSSVTSVSLLRRSDGTALLASGDWDGGLSVWKVPPLTGGGGGGVDGNNVAASTKKKKQRTSSSSKSNNSSSDDVAAVVEEVQPLASWKVHASNVSGIAHSHGQHSGGGCSDGGKVITGSWDHSLKVWDVERQDCILTLNGSRVVTALGRCHNSDVVASGHPDCTVRLWDMRVASKGGGASGAVSDGTLKPSHKSWVSAVQWSPTDPYVLASTSHDGTVKVWDIRSSLPLHTVRAHPKGEKGLCLAYGDDGVIYSGGSDCIVKRFVC